MLLGSTGFCISVQVSMSQLAVELHCAVSDRLVCLSAGCAEPGVG